MPNVTFEPDDVTVRVKDGENLLRAAMMADVLVTASCGGDGTCGKCRMIVEEGSVDTRHSSKLSKTQVAQGYVLACLTTVTGNATVRIPPESRPGTAPSRARSGRVANTVLSAKDCSARVPARRDSAAITKRLVEMGPPDLTDNASDLTRLKQALRRQHKLSDVHIPIQAVRDLPHVGRAGDWTLTAITVEPSGSTPSVTGFDSGDTATTAYGLAVDIGTTTIEVSLVDLASGEVLANAAEYNAQVARGEDVITRVIASAKDDGLKELQRLVLDTIASLATSVCSDAGIDTSNVIMYVAAGNTVMTHLFLGVSPQNIRVSPYIPAAAQFPWVSTRELGLPGHPGAEVATIPCPASWLGGDIVSGVMASGIPWSDKLTLFVDIGTNGEIVLGNKDWLVACSCSAGPAFEGGGILHGMRAATGAIEQVRINAATLEPVILSIDNAKPLGICGSGLIDAVSELFICGALDRNGTLDTDLDSEWIREGDHGREYVLVGASESGTGEAIVLTETDIENLIRAKAAIYAGISVLAESLDLTLDRVDEVIIAGGFGHYLDLERVMAIGMIPELPLERFSFIGNGSLLGARLAAESREMLKRASRVAEMVTYLELSVNAAFMESYVSAAFLPHTDTTLFPCSEKLLKARRLERAVS